MPQTTTITNEALLKKLTESKFTDEQKKSIAELIPEMNEEQRQELISLISQSFEVAEKEAEADKEYQAELRKLNEEYMAKLDAMVKKETENVRKEYEKLEKGEEAEEMKELEKEIEEM